MTAFIFSNGTVKNLSFDDMKKLWSDLTIGEDKAIIGQPVLLSAEVTVLRIALGAQVVIEALAGHNTDEARTSALARVRSEDMNLVLKLKNLCALKWNHFQPPPVNSSSS
jgi:hypothetical protein